jgi:predicted XRE-type DNA-binding protein
MVEGDSIMHEEVIEVVHGSGNVFQDFSHPHSDVEQLRALLAAKIIRTLDEERLSTRAAEARTGVNHSEFSRIRRANLGRFTVDRLITILNLLDQEVDTTVTIRPRVALSPSIEMHP